MILHARGAAERVRASREFRHVLVDEFQDTDPLQFSLLESLRERGGAGLFAVGDPKQSIYRFRHADPALFAGTIAQADERIELDGGIFQDEKRMSWFFFVNNYYKDMKIKQTKDVA